MGVPILSAQPDSERDEMSGHSGRDGNAGIDFVIYLLVLACTGVLFWGIAIAGIAAFASIPEIDSSGVATGIGVALGAILVMQVAGRRMSFVDDE